MMIQVDGFLNISGTSILDKALCTAPLLNNAGVSNLVDARIGLDSTKRGEDSTMLIEETECLYHECFQAEHAAD